MKKKTRNDLLKRLRHVSQSFSFFRANNKKPLWFRRVVFLLLFLLLLDLRLISQKKAWCVHNCNSGYRIFYPFEMRYHSFPQGQMVFFFLKLVVHFLPKCFRPGSQLRIAHLGVCCFQKLFVLIWGLDDEKKTKINKYKWTSNRIGSFKSHK